MHKILGTSEATADQMASYLLSVNPFPKIPVGVEEFCQLFLSIAATEGVRGDALFAQSCKETGNFSFNGTVKSFQNNYAGLGTTDPNTPGASFTDAYTGILAQAQHAKAYATKEALNHTCVDPRYKVLVQCGKIGIAQHWEELGGNWAVPGYDTKKYKSLQHANNANDSYGYQIIKILNKILQIPKEIAVKKKPIIVLDAGHGMGTAGKRCLKSIDPNQTREWWLNDRIADGIQDCLLSYDCTVLRVDDTTGIKDISLSSRVKAANTSNADIYISIHHNAGINGGTGGGTAVYYYSDAAARPFQAQRLYDAIVTYTGLKGNRSRKVIKKGFYVVKNTKMPAFLIENGFMDSITDVPIILTEDHAIKTARGISEFLVVEFGLTKSVENVYTDVKTEASVDQSDTSESNAGHKIIYYPKYTSKKTTLIAAMTSLGIKSDYSYRKQVAKVNGITNYMGTKEQNIQMYNLLVAGLLKSI